MMAAAAGRTVYVYSGIPRLAKHVQDRLPAVKVIEVKCKGMASVFCCIEELSAITTGTGGGNAGLFEWRRRRRKGDEWRRRLMILMLIDIFLRGVD